MADMVVSEDTKETEVVKIEPNLDFIDKLEPDDGEAGKIDDKVVEEGKEPGEKKADDAKVGADAELDAEGKPIVKEVAAEAVKTDDEKEELKSLRQIAREQKRELDKVTTALGEVNQKLKDANLITEEDEEKAKEVQEAHSQRLNQLDNLLDVMRLNPKFEDVDVVASQEHVDDLIEAIGKKLVAEEGGTLKEAMVRVENEIWTLRNPYVFLYENVKRYHPDYAAPKVEGEGKDDAGKEKKPEVKSDDEVKKKLTVEKIATSIQDIGGGGNNEGGWTAARIDDLDELEIDKVPAEIYQKYLRNELK